MILCGNRVCVGVIACRHCAALLRRRIAVCRMVLSFSLSLIHTHTLSLSLSHTHTHIRARTRACRWPTFCPWCLTPRQCPCPGVPPGLHDQTLWTRCHRKAWCQARGVQEPVQQVRAFYATAPHDSLRCAIPLQCPPHGLPVVIHRAEFSCCTFRTTSRVCHVALDTCPLIYNLWGQRRAGLDLSPVCYTWWCNCMQVRQR